MAKVCAASGGRMVPFCAVNPYRRDTAVAEFRRCVEVLNMRGLKDSSLGARHEPQRRLVDELCEMAAHWHIPLLFHDGTPCYSLPSQIALLARRHPATTMILGHCGLFERCARQLRQCVCGEPLGLPVRPISGGPKRDRTPVRSATAPLGYRLRLLVHRRGRPPFWPCSSCCG